MPLAVRSSMIRKPPADVLRLLPREVGFGCPVPECGNPYLEWHHFDPPWSEEQHHRPEGMIALCIEHHKKADGGAYTVEQLRLMKQNRAAADVVRGRFDWLRNELLAVVGGNFFHETHRILTIDARDVIWLRRDEDGYLRLNVRMLSLLPRERAIIDDNAWTNIGMPTDLRSPPSGKELTIDYENGDYLQVKFHVLESAEAAYEKYKATTLRAAHNVLYPLTAVEVNYRIGGTRIEFRPDGTTLGGVQMRGCFASHCGGGVDVNVGGRWVENPSLLPFKPTSRLEQCPCGSGLRYKHCHGLLK